MHIWPFQVDGDGLARAGAGLFALAVCALVRNIAIVVWCGRSHEMLRFPPRREFRPRFARRRHRSGREPRPLGRADRMALWAGIAAGSLVLIAVAFVAALATLFLGLAALGAVGWFLGPVVAAVVWSAVAVLSVVLPVRRPGNRATALGRLYRSARTMLTSPTGDSGFYLPSPLWPLVIWADQRIMPRVDISSGPAPWADGQGPGRRTFRSARSGR